MRLAASAALAVLLGSSAAIAQPAKLATPSGHSAAPLPVDAFRGAPIVCHPPELVALSKEIHRSLCVQADILANLAAMGPELKAAATSPFLQHPFLKDFQEEPSGGPDTITCRGDGLAYSAITCAHNRFWAFMDGPLPMGSPDLAPYIGSPAENPAPPPQTP